MRVVFAFKTVSFPLNFFSLFHVGDTWQSLWSAASLLVSPAAIPSLSSSFRTLLPLAADATSKLRTSSSEGGEDTGATSPPSTGLRGRTGKVRDEKGWK